MVGAFEAVDVVLFRRKNSLAIVAKIAPDHDIFCASNRLIINHFQSNERFRRVQLRLQLIDSKYSPTRFRPSLCGTPGNGKLTEPQ
jgi:hypothetical protein